MLQLWTGTLSAGPFFIRLREHSHQEELHLEQQQSTEENGTAIRQNVAALQVNLNCLCHRESKSVKGNKRRKHRLPSINHSLSATYAAEQVLSISLRIGFAFIPF